MTLLTAAQDISPLFRLLMIHEGLIYGSVAFVQDTEAPLSLSSLSS